MIDEDDEEVSSFKLSFSLVPNRDIRLFLKSIHPYYSSLHILLEIKGCQITRGTKHQMEVVVVVIGLKGWCIQSFEPVKLTFLPCKHVMIVVGHVGFFKEVSFHTDSLTAKEVVMLLLNAWLRKVWIFCRYMVTGT